MKITRSQLKQIIKEELGRSLEEDEGAEGGLYDIYPKSSQTDYRTEFEIIANDLGEISRMTKPDALETGDQLDVVLDQAAIEEIHNMATDALDTISEYITQMMTRKEIPKPDRYDREERAIRRAGPKGPMSPEEHAKYMSLYGED